MSADSRSRDPSPIARALRLIAATECQSGSSIAVRANWISAGRLSEAGAGAAFDPASMPTSRASVAVGSTAPPPSASMELPSSTRIAPSNASPRSR